MKRLFAIVSVIIGMCSAATAQELMVRDFKADPTDLNAVVNQVNDANGQPCALVRLGLAVPNASFEGDIIKTEEKNGEYWIYMPDGSNWLNVKTPDFLPLRYDFPEAVASNTTYVLNIIKKHAGTAMGDKLPVTLPARSGASIGGVATDAGLPVTFNIIRVKGGMFKMGGTPEQESTETDELPVHWVTITKDFYIGETEVTQELWEYIMGNNPSAVKEPTLPVTNITLKDATEFLTRLNQLTKAKFRLPTEAEWEYAARGGHLTKHFKYSGGDNWEELGFNYSNSSSRPQPVKSKKPNELGLYDMSGNVWEMCQDYKNQYTKEDAVDPMDTKEARNRVCRGGAWDSESSEELRNAYRRRYKEERPERNIGLRIVWSID